MATKCNEKAIKKCVTKSEVCNTDTAKGSCIKVGTALNRIKENDNLKLDINKGVFGPTKKVDAITIQLDDADIKKLRLKKEEVEKTVQKEKEKEKPKKIVLPAVEGSPESPVSEPKENLNGKNKNELKKILKDLGGVPSNKIKADLIKTIEELRKKQAKSVTKAKTPPPLESESEESPIPPPPPYPPEESPIPPPPPVYLKKIFPLTPSPFVAPSAKKSPVAVAPVSFFLTENNMKTREWTIEKLRKLLLDSYNVSTKAKITKKEIVNLVLKTQNEKSKFKVDVETINCENSSYNIDTKACEEPKDGLYVLDYNGNKYHGTEKDLGLFAQINNFQGYKIVKKENLFKQAVERCEELKCDESCNIETGECEEPEEYVLEYNGKRFHGSKESLEQLAIGMNFEGYSINKVGEIEEESEEQQFEFEPEVSLRELEESPIPSPPPEFDIQEYKEVLHVSPLTPEVKEKKKIALGVERREREKREEEQRKKQREKYMSEIQSPIEEVEPETIQDLINLAGTVSGMKKISEAEIELMNTIKQFIDDEGGIV